MRRTFVSVVGALMLFMAGMIPVVAHDQHGAATPESAFAELGLPELDVTMTTEGYEGIPAEVPANRYLVNLTIAEGAAEFGGGIAFAQAPDMTAEAFLAEMMNPDATMTAGGIPELLFNAHYAGGIYSFDGAPVQVVLDITPGEWIAWADDPEAPQAPVIFQATGTMPAELPEPATAATFVMGEYVIEMTEGTLAAGSQVVRIDNIGAQPHFIGWFQGPDDMTAEQVGVALDEEMQAGMTGTPAAYSGLNPEEDLMPLVFTATQSTNTSIWITVDLAAGKHGLACFFPDLADGAPHSNHGMYAVIEVSE
jgi:hypothetical protein